MVAMEKTFMQLPEITLGMIPGMGGVVIPYRKWPQAAAKFHSMIGKAERLTVQEAVEIGIVKKTAKSFPELIDAAIAEVGRLQGNVPRIADGPVSIPSSSFLMIPGRISRSAEILGIIGGVINRPRGQDAVRSPGNRLPGRGRHLLRQGLQGRGYGLPAEATARIRQIAATAALSLPRVPGLPPGARGTSIPYLVSPPPMNVLLLLVGLSSGLAHSVYSAFSKALMNRIREPFLLFLYVSVIQAAITPLLWVFVPARYPSPEAWPLLLISAATCVAAYMFLYPPFTAAMSPA